jgi:hypothetical protein
LGGVESHIERTLQPEGEPSLGSVEVQTRDTKVEQNDVGAGSWHYAGEVTEIEVVKERLSSVGLEPFAGEGEIASVGVEADEPPRSTHPSEESRGVTCESERGIDYGIAECRSGEL